MCNYLCGNDKRVTNIEDENDGETHSDCYDNDYDAEDADDDLFLPNNDKEVNDNNELTTN
jgi:hypothetical protein